MPIPSKRYLGDAVYVEYDGYHVVLTTSDGIRDTNTIALEPIVRESLKSWMYDLYAGLQEKNHQPSELSTLNQEDR